MRFEFILIFLLGFSLFTGQSIRAQSNFKLVTFATDDGGVIEGAFFTAETKKAVIFAHGAIFNKESWYFLAEELQPLKIASLAIDFRGYGNSKASGSNHKAYDITGAIAYLQDQGFTDISLVGGSMGGAAVLEALSMTTTGVKRAVLLAPAGGPSIKSDKIDKLFIVSTDEGLYPRVVRLYNDSSRPKSLKEYAGRAHAQHMFKEDYAEELTRLILDFLNKN